MEGDLEKYKKNKSRLERIKIVRNKVAAILKSAHENGGIFSFFFSKHGWAMAKKLFHNFVGVLLKNDNSAKRVAYAIWLNKNLPTEEDINRYKKEALVFDYKPLISLIVPVYNTKVEFLSEMVDSVKNQVYTNWELCLSDDNSTSDDTIKALKDFAEHEPRIKVVFRKENGHISACTNSALDIASGEYCALVDHDDILTKDALFEMVKLLQNNPEADFVYSDEDKMDENGLFVEPHFKPQWCPDNLLSRNYLGHLSILRTSILKEIGGFRKGFEGSQDHDLYLRFTEKTNKVFHVPKILYRWRMHMDSVALNAHSKPYAYIAGENAVKEAVERRGEPAAVEMTEDLLGFYTVRYAIEKLGKVSIIIPAKNKAALLKQCVDSIFKKSTYLNFEIIIVDNGSTELEFLKLVEGYLEKYKDVVRHFVCDEPFNFSRLINFGVSKADGEFVLLLNNDTKVVTPDWIEGLLEQAQRSSVGAVSPKLLFPDGTIQHAGIVFDNNNLPIHVFSGVSNFLYNNFHIAVNNFPALTAACLMVKKKTFEAVNGFDESFAVEFNDIDFCLKLIQEGYNNTCIPHVQLTHYESASRGRAELSKSKYKVYLEERTLFEKRWKPYIVQFNSNNALCYAEFLQNN